jgi:beta-glucosidase
MKAGYEAQLRSVVMAKNKNSLLPLQKNKKVYIPKRFTPAGRNYIGMPFPEKSDYPINMALVSKYFTVTDDPEEADLALVFIEGAVSGNGYDSEDVKNGGTGYIPISLQYKPYTALTARNPSIAGGDPMEKFTDRSYKGKSATAFNTADLNMVLDTRKLMKTKPVIVSVHLSNPSVFAEFEKQADAILVSFGVQDQALLDILTGNAEPSALLPLQIPANMKTVESQLEDVPLDMTCHIDDEGNTYDFGFGLNWKGRINDARTIKYKGK